MKNILHNLLILLVFLAFTNLNAQENKNEKKYFFNNITQLNKQSSLLLENKSKVKTQSQDSFVLLNQTGNNNQVLIKSGSEDSQLINQKGKNNYYQFISYYNSTPSNFNILQKGNSNSLQIYGENSLIKNMSIIQKTNNKAILIKNY